MREQVEIVVLCLCQVEWGVAHVVMVALSCVVGWATVEPQPAAFVFLASASDDVMMMMMMMMVMMLMMLTLMMVMQMMVMMILLTLACNDDEEEKDDTDDDITAIDVDMVMRMMFLIVAVTFARIRMIVHMCLRLKTWLLPWLRLPQR